MTPRENERIERILTLLKAAWAKNPDYRLFQLLINIARSPNSHPELFYLEDNVIENRLSDYISTGKYPEPLNIYSLDRLSVWNDNGSVQIKAVSGFGDPMDLNADEAKEFANKILKCADEADA